jgi:glycosyltransferase involved in cell wall biosynthesis
MGLQKKEHSNVVVAQLSSVHPWDDIRIFWKECCSLAKEGFVVHLVARGDTKEVPNQVILHKFEGCKGRLQRLFRSGEQVYQIAMDLDADIYHLHDPELIKCGIRLKKLGKKVIYDAHEDLPAQVMAKGYIPRPFRKIVAFWAKHLLLKADRSFDGIVAATPEIAKRFSNRNTVIVRNYPLLSEFQTEPLLSYEKRPNRIVYIGGLSEKRGIREITNAISALPDDLSVRLDLAGSFGNSDLKDQILQNNKVQFHGFLNRAEIQKLLSEVKIGLVVLHPTPNHIKSLPIKMFEYMAAGIPVIASDFPLWREIVTAYDCGLLVDPYSVEEIAKAMDFLLKNPERAKEMGRNGKKAIQTIINWEVEFQQLLRLYS